MADEKEVTTKKSAKNPLLVISIIFLLLVLIGLGMNFFVKKAGTSLLEGVIESKTGVKTDIGNLENGQMQFTDTKTGQKVSIGSNQVPENFPSDFPKYPNAAVTSSMSGSQQGQANGMYVTFSTTDSLDDVVSYYTLELKAKGWEITSTFNADNMYTWGIAKGTWEGTLSVSADDSGTTTIIVTLGVDEDNN